MYLEKRITILATAADNGVTEDAGIASWGNPEALALLERLTLGKSVIMGHKTLQSLGTLPGRQCIVLARHGYEDVEGAEIGGGRFLMARTIEGAIGACDSPEAFVIGGQKAYNDSLKYADEIWLVRVHSSPASCRTFRFDAGFWNLESAREFVDFSILHFSRVLP